MRKLIILSITATSCLSWIFFCTTAFTNRKCDHVFVEVEQANIKVEHPGLLLGGNMIYQTYSWPTGLQEGKELICVKCFHVQKQVLDYGKPEQTGQTLGSLGWPKSSLINAGPYYDTTFTMAIGGQLKIDSDSIVDFGHPIEWSKHIDVVDSSFYKIILKHHPKLNKKAHRRNDGPET